ncbi:MAG TPA: hypothetical protein DCP25_19590 [Chloroflexi bacterium]|nr:hypothetical protein [Chloroflexota bacterium]
MEEEALAGAHARDRCRDRGGLRRGGGHVAREVRFAQAELDWYAAHAARAADREPARGEAPCRSGRAARVHDVSDGGRARRERAQGHELARAEPRHAARERLVARGRDAEHGLGALAARRREAAARAGRERGGKHRADRVGEPAPVRLGDPAAERELPPGKQGDRMHEPIKRLELAVRGYVERDDDAVDRSRAEAGAHEMADPDIKPLGDAIREGARGSA